KASRNGHEVFLHMPMEPVGPSDPGPKALLAGMSSDSIRDRLEWAIARVSGATGMNNHMGSRMTADPVAMSTVMDVLREHGLEFVDSRTTAGSVAAAAAAEEGLMHTWRDVFIDAEPGSAFAVRQTAAAEEFARQRGTVVAIAHPLPTTLAV